MIQDRSPQSVASHCDTVVTFGADRAGAAVVHLRGEYDRTNVTALASRLSGAIASGDGEVVVDLADVQFMDASTIKVLDEAAVFLGHRVRSLLLRRPTTLGRHLLDVCGLGDLIEVTPDRLMLSA